MERLQVVHDKKDDTVWIAWIDEKTSGTMTLTAEEAQSIGSVGKMAAAAKEAKK
jgi:hypothetical protein